MTTKNNDNAGNSTQPSSQQSHPQSYFFGQNPDWDAMPVPVILFVELPFWLMVPDCSLQVEVNGHTFQVEVKSNFFELYAHEARDSRASRIYMGPPGGALNPELQQAIDEQQIPVMPRKCKTVLRIHSRCNADVLVAEAEEGARANEARAYLEALCEAHLEVVNRVVRQYRLSTYDYFPYEVSPWDVPTWMVEPGNGSISITLLNYARWDIKPIMRWDNDHSDEYKLIEPTDLQTNMTADASAGELELLDALNLMERGDFSGAVRRVTTSIEAIVESVLRTQLLQRYSQAEVESRLHASRNDFPGRLRQYERLSGRTLPAVLASELETTRNLRHAIVHRGARIAYADRGQAQRAVDTGRWIFNWFEDQPDRFAVREKRIGMRSLGRRFSLFDAEITSDGVVVYKPSDLDETQQDSQQ